jgi:hypothetical protein
MCCLLFQLINFRLLISFFDLLQNIQRYMIFLFKKSDEQVAGLHELNCTLQKFVKLLSI